jgi:hypothetical protein
LRSVIDPYADGGPIRMAVSCDSTSRSTRRDSSPLTWEEPRPMQERDDPESVAGTAPVPSGGVGPDLRRIGAAPAAAAVAVAVAGQAVTSSARSWCRWGSVSRRRVERLHHALIAVQGIHKTVDVSGPANGLCLRLECTFVRWERRDRRTPLVGKTRCFADQNAFRAPAGFGSKHPADLHR